MEMAVAYFVRVFVAGFALGTVRTLLVVPRLGERMAELLELPLMLLVVYMTARWLVRRFPAARQSRTALTAGLRALALLIAAEIALGLGTRGGSLRDVLLDRDPVSGAAYYASLCVFGLMPWLLARAWRSTAGPAHPASPGERHAGR